MIWVSEVSWDVLLDAFRRPRRRMERVAFFDGVAAGGHSVVTTVTVPDARLAARYYDVSPEAMSEAAAQLRRNGLVRLAQVHTHGGHWLDHSPRDDAMAYSQKLGAISIVLPDHARHRPRFAQSAIHVREGDGWRRLDPHEARLRIRVVPSLVDLRR
jgi:hypothetical protein